ncbi:hypothetical protein Aple_060960 [Acrocarpospora pleiomorpha]|uniref:Uncharacterized protein n=1 Tax=Acrocarpospora pleiomorpha TaxID=90975 RepID=A0A5M3XPB5_9ACTN|nr:hypothetical protein [Acrocarpospora pleiomorpha]GES23197.1 hypothetical protein Aple_060960 [Acrocarpospora pleiomorpha]
MSVVTRILRTIATIALWISCCGVSSYLSARVHDIPALAQHGYVVEDLVGLVVGWTPAIILGALARLVSYRARDGLMYLIPVYGPFIFAPTILWRVAYLPRRDWQPRPGEIDMALREVV